MCVQVSSGSDEPVRSLASRWPPSAGSHVGDDAWGSASDRGGVAAGHLRQLTINTGWSASTQPRHVQVCLPTCFVWHDTIHTIPYNTHTHPFNGPLSGTTQVSWYQKGKTNLDLLNKRQSNQIKSNMTLIMVDKPQPSYNLLNVMK